MEKLSCNFTPKFTVDFKRDRPQPKEIPLKSKLDIVSVALKTLLGLREKTLQLLEVIQISVLIDPSYIGPTKVLWEHKFRVNAILVDPFGKKIERFIDLEIQDDGIPVDAPSAELVNMIEATVGKRACEIREIAESLI